MFKRDQVKGRLAACATAGAVLVGFGASAQAESVYDGITFPEGDISFADKVIEYDPAYGGGNIPTQTTDPQAAIGAPDGTAVALGSGGRLTLQFTDNALTGSGDNTPDLHIFEVGPLAEDTFIEISKDGVTFYDVGKVFGSTDSIDIDGYGFGVDDEFFFVRLRDDPNENQSSGPYVGADIDAVGAISTVAATPPSPTVVPLPAPAFAGLGLFAGLGVWQAVRRRRNGEMA